jgi:hypothetical protein
VDYALHSSWFGSWEVNNEFKPDMDYHYEGPPDAYDTSALPTPSRFYYDSLIPFDERMLAFTNDTHEIFAYAAESRGAALGIQSSVNGFTLFDLAEESLSYTRFHYSHSRQFRSNIVDEKQYWGKIVEHCSLEVIPQKGSNE